MAQFSNHFLNTVYMYMYSAIRVKLEVTKQNLKSIFELYSQILLTIEQWRWSPGLIELGLFDLNLLLNRVSPLPFLHPWILKICDQSLLLVTREETTRLEHFVSFVMGCPKISMRCCHLEKNVNMLDSLILPVMLKYC